MKTDSSGNIQWQNTIAGANWDNLWWVQQTSDGKYILGGKSDSDISGDKTENSNGGSDYWVVKITDKFNSISGKLFIDANSNSIQDTGELPLGCKRITETFTDRFNFSDQNGNYLVSVLDTGNFSVYPELLNYYNAVPSAQAAFFSGIQQTDSQNDFAFQPAGVFNDLCVTLTPISGFSPGFDASYMISYENVGTTSLSGTVIFFPDSNLTFVLSSPIATSVTIDSIVWNTGTLSPFQTGNILITLNVNPGTPVGILISSSAVIEPVSGDANAYCNYASYEVLVTGSEDPNAILVDRDTVLTTELSNPPYLEYIIYFQNTGNDTAFNIKILNPFPQRLKLSSFEFISSSHPVNINYSISEKAMWFTFENILLPDSNVNEAASHGYVRYRAKPKTILAAGNKIENNAAIYFDFNQPVMTDTAVTEIVLPVGIPQWSVTSDQLALYPNPAANTLTIKLPQVITDHGQLTTYDLFGREVYHSAISNQQSTIKIDVSGLAEGIYLIEINSAEKIYRGKFVKE